MNATIFIGLVNNAALLLSLVLIYDTLSPGKREKPPILTQITSGLIIGGMAIILMLTPVKWEAGIIFDTRTILLGVTGLFFGAIPTLLAMTIAGAFRLNLGGGGALMGVATILSSGLIGLAWRYNRFRESREFSPSELYLFGAVVHAVMILCMFLLPQGVILKTIRSLALPVIIIYPIAAALLGALLVGRLRRYRIGEELRVLKDILQEQNEELQMNEEELRTQNDELQVTEEMLRVQIEEYETSRKLLQAGEEERQLLEQQLIQTQKMEAIGTLAGGIAHDFNNMLSPIIGYAEMARGLEKDDPRLSDYLGHISVAATRATDLVRQILTFSRKTTREKMPLHISSVVKEALKLLRPSIPSTIEIRQEIASEALILADPTQVHQIVMNLCTNAWQSMEQAGGILAVSLKEIEIPQEQIMGDEITPGAYLVLEVSDTGCGMDEETRKKIFDPYFTTKEKEKGTGLGLAVVLGIVKDHLGLVTVYSEPERGTTFRVYLPVATGEASAQPTERLEVTPTRNHERILFVDDEGCISDMAKDYLTSYGYVVDVCSNGRNALFFIEQTPNLYDLLVTDVTMPGMNGKQLAQKALAIRPDLPIIICTGYSSLIDREEADRIGIRDYVEKPMAMSDLLRRIQSVLDNAAKL